MSLYKSYALQKMVQFFWPTLYNIIHVNVESLLVSSVFFAVADLQVADLLYCQLNTTHIKHNINYVHHQKC